MKAICNWILMLSMLTLAGCAGVAKQPDWISGNSSKYDPSRYLIGRGQADLSAVARDRARADLAKIFQVSISEHSKDMLAYASSAGAPPSQNQLESEISRSIETRTDQIIEGVRIGEVWQDPESKTHYALAVLDRLQIGNSLRQTIAQLDSATRSYVEQARSGKNLFIKIGAARNALAAQLERGQYQRYLNIVDRTGMGSAPMYETARLAADYEALLKRLRISTHIVNDPFGGLDPVVSGALANAGFLHESGEDAADYIMNAGLDVSELADNQGWHWVRGTLEIVLRQKSDNKVLGSHRWNVKASSQQKEVARKRAMDQVAQVLKQELGQVVTSFGSQDK